MHYDIVGLLQWCFTQTQSAGEYSDMLVRTAFTYKLLRCRSPTACPSRHPFLLRSDANVNANVLRSFCQWQVAEMRPLYVIIQLPLGTKLPSFSRLW